jgi:hypothetical protein
MRGKHNPQSICGSPRRIRRRVFSPIRVWQDTAATLGMLVATEKRHLRPAGARRYVLNGERLLPMAGGRSRPVRRKCRVGQRAPKRKRPDRKPYRLGGEGKLACFAHPYAEDRDLLGVMKACSCRLSDRNE